MTPFEMFIMPARARTSLWRFALGIVLILTFCGLGIVAAIFVPPLVWPTGSDYVDSVQRFLSSIPDGSPQLTLTVLASFAGIWIGVLFAGRLHGEPFGRFFSAFGGKGLRQFMKGAGFGIMVTLGALVAGNAMLEYSLRSGLEPGQWVAFLIPVVALIFVQATAEELVFRGYLLQQLAARSHHWIVWAALPSFLFGLVHYSPELAGGGAYYYVVSMFLFGLVSSALVWRSGSLWPAVGLHVTTNIFFLAIVGVNDRFTGTLLWTLGFGDVIPAMKLNLVVNALMLGFVLSPLGRVFDEDTPDSGGALAHKPDLCQ